MTIKILFQLFFVCGAVVFESVSALGCSIPGMPPSRFDRSQYVFSGEVTGYVMSENPLPPARKNINLEAVSPTAGIVVLVKDSLFTPRPVKKTYEVYRFGLGAGCELYGLSLEFFKERYPIGQTVQVFAGPADHLPPSTVPDVGRLEIRYVNSDAISIVTPLDRTIRNSTDSPGFDYKKHQNDLLGDPYFEITKDMLRLENSKAVEERDSILDRMTYFPRKGWLTEVFMQYARFPNEFDKWNELANKRALTPEAFKRYYEALAQRDQRTSAPK